jgi:tetratricopeptide (TPR) repeat protein
LHIELLFPYDRFTLITMLGASLLLAGLIGLITRRRWQSALLLALIVAFSTLLQFQQRLLYRQEWLSQRNFFWQLAWRAPSIQPGTMLMTSEIPFTYYTDNSLTAPLNWIYDPENNSRQMDYLLYDIEARLNSGLPAIAANIPIDMFYRAKTFKGSTGQALVLFYDPPRCLKVLDPAIDRFLPVRPLYIKEATPLSRLELIGPGTGQAPQPLEQLLGPEPPRSWCYFFEKAELYNQMGDWDQAAQAADQALKLTRHFTEKNVSELIPFVEAYAHTGQWVQATRLTSQAVQIWDKTRFPLCDAWRRIAATTPPGPGQKAAIDQINADFGCKIP